VTVPLAILAVAASYTLGAIPFALIVGFVWRGVDIRSLGSGNVGAANIYRNLGLGPGALVFALDTAKGAGAVAIASLFGGSEWVRVLGGVGAIAGHMFSPFLGFKGGKGVATSLGVMLALAPGVALICLGIWAILLAGFRYVSLASIVAVGAVPFVMTAQGVEAARLAFGIAIALGVFVKHIPNIGRLIRRAEPTVSFGPASAKAGEAAPGERIL
jgi:glycerol-3-phosphate acyltransferase PlsY